jgi:hypothetical protein
LKKKKKKKKKKKVDASFIAAVLTAHLELTAELQHAFNGEIVVASAN